MERNKKTYSFTLDPRTVKLVDEEKHGMIQRLGLRSRSEFVELMMEFGLANEEMLSFAVANKKFLEQQLVKAFEDKNEDEVVRLMRVNPLKLVKWELEQF